MGFSPDTGGTLDTGLEAFWKLDEASGTRFDAFSNNDLTDINTVAQNTGIIGNATQHLASSGERLEIADNASLSFSGNESFSIAGWIYLDTKTGNPHWCAKYDGGGGPNEREYRLFHFTASDRLNFVVSSDGITTTQVVANSFGSTPTGVFIFVACWHDAVADTINIQVNNGTVDSVGHSAGVFDGIAPFILGSRKSGGAVEFWNGRIDEIGVWRKVLSAQERTDLYNGGAGNTFTFSPIQTIFSDTSIFGTVTKTLDSDVTLLTGIFSQTIDSTFEILPAPVVKTIDADTFIQKEATQTIDSDTGVAGTTTQGIASNTSIVAEVAQSIVSDTNIIVSAAELKLFKESDLSTEVGTTANPVDFSSVEAGLSVQHPDNPFVLFND
ncbi:hypothetical protein LCGC14_2529650, partial [marine sediment metagenome]